MTAAFAALHAASDAASFAIEASVPNGSAASARSAACSIIRRAWSSATFASTSRKLTAWNSWIFFPNASRCFA
jgi:hypothetical protein